MDDLDSIFSIPRSAADIEGAFADSTRRMVLLRDLAITDYLVETALAKGIVDGVAEDERALADITVELWPTPSEASKS